MNKYQKEYIHRVNRVVDYIEDNINEQLSLQKVSEIAHFSPFHFHRICPTGLEESNSFQFVPQERSNMREFRQGKHPTCARSFRAVCNGCGCSWDTCYSYSPKMTGILLARYFQAAGRIEGMLNSCRGYMYGM